MLILASASPRRRQLLQMLGLEFEARPQLCREQSQSRDPADYVTDIALQKAQSAQAQAGPEDWILAADTAVCLDGQILGKPTDLEDARRMLALLSGKIHQVHTGLCLLRGQRIWRWQERRGVLSPFPAADLLVYLHRRAHGQGGSLWRSGLGRLAGQGRSRGFLQCDGSASGLPGPGSPAGGLWV